MKPLIWLVSLAAIGLALGIAIAGPGTRFGWWEYSTGLRIIQDAAIPTMVAAGASAVGFIVSLIGARALAPLTLVAAVLAGAASYAPFRMNQLVDANPVIHDITTDFQNPPPIVAAAEMKRVNPPTYNAGEEVPRSELPLAETQKKAFPDIKPMTYDLSADKAAEMSLTIVRSMGMKVLSDTNTDDGRLIEAADTSLWFGFVDDFIVRIQEEEGGVRIDLRSKSRVGRSDLGENARRAQKFMQAFDERMTG